MVTPASDPRRAMSFHRSRNPYVPESQAFLVDADQRGSAGAHARFPAPRRARPAHPPGMSGDPTAGRSRRGRQPITYKKPSRDERETHNGGRTAWR